MDDGLRSARSRIDEAAAQGASGLTPATRRPVDALFGHANHLKVLVRLYRDGPTIMPWEKRRALLMKSGLIVAAYDGSDI